MIKIKNISKSFGKNNVLDNVNIDIVRDKVTTIIGPSGVGKSVLLKLIIGALSPDSGNIIIDGQDITLASSEEEKNKIRENIGVLFQNAALLDSLTVYENIAFPLKARGGMTKEEIHEKVIFLIDSLDLAPVYNKLPQSIPLSVRKQVGLARALIGKPKVVLIDEPNTGLDPVDGQSVYNLIKYTKEKWGYTALIISHEIPEVFQVSDNVVMLLNSKVIAEGSPFELQSSNDPRVQQFLKGNVDGPIVIQ